MWLGGDGRSRSSVIAVTLLPHPDFADQTDGASSMHFEGDVLHHPHPAGVGGEAEREPLHPKQGRGLPVCARLVPCTAPGCRHGVRWAQSKTRRGK